ncbi:prisilkin-39-like [Daktulosphaira vitifoliae]|uniref:prisilkin-39-like n=1 Tax=Daktulosphaira vitifoliae TaxID=58002 RepID=UPI0021AAAB95|nr:prisilkin-39-like [Daktulosphaira vitifoliae]
MMSARLVMLASLATLTLARPDAGYSYSSSSPSSSYGAPSSSYAAPSSSGGYSSGGYSSGGYSTGGLSSGGLSSGYSGSSSSYASAPISSGYSSGGSSSYSSGGSSGYSSGYNYAPVAPIVQKHIYVHVPPPEQEYIAPQPTQSIAPPQKHYKIIFIKAPTPPTPTVPHIPVIPQDSEKTLIYVLVKKPEEQPQITIPTAAPTAPSKPEVYFIKYKAQKESGYPASSGANYASSGAGGYSGDLTGPSASYGSPSAGLSSSYGSPSASPSASYGAPSSSGSY